MVENVLAHSIASRSNSGPKDRSLRNDTGGATTGTRSPKARAVSNTASVRSHRVKFPAPLQSSKPALLIVNDGQIFVNTMTKT